jgi:hypothetical protein
MSESEQRVSLDLSPQGFAAKQAKTLLTTTRAGGTQELTSVTLAPYTVYIGELSK